MTEHYKGLSRRRFLASSLVTGVAVASEAATLTGPQQWIPFDHNGPLHYVTPGWKFFTDAEARAVEAIVEQLIPADELSVSGKDAGCAVFIDRQLSGSYGQSSRLYMQGPFANGTPEQGDQNNLTPCERYRLGLAELANHCDTQFQKTFDALDPQQRDQVLNALEQGHVGFKQIDARVFFQQVLGNTMEGFFADPVYGGNRDMVAWKMIGFPGARYDYRDYVSRHNEKLDLEPLSIIGSSAWTQGS
jgi:gluconate 2-dehydrogenase gamma chain